MKTDGKIGTIKNGSFVPERFKKKHCVHVGYKRNPCVCCVPLVVVPIAAGFSSASKVPLCDIVMTTTMMMTKPMTMTMMMMIVHMLHANRHHIFFTGIVLSFFSFELLCLGGL